MHTIADEASPAGPIIVLGQEILELIHSLNAILACVNTQQDQFRDRDFDTRIKERPTKSDLNNITKTITELMKQHQVSPRENPFSYLWIANCVLYSVVLVFFLSKGWKKQRSGTPRGLNKQQRWKREYERRAAEVRKKISIAQVELERLKKNRKIPKKGKGNSAILEWNTRVCPRQKATLRKLKRGFSRTQKQDEARVLNQQFQVDARRVYSNMHC